MIQQRTDRQEKGVCGEGYEICRVPCLFLCLNYRRGVSSTPFFLFHVS